MINRQSSYVTSLRLGMLPLIALLASCAAEPEDVGDDARDLGASASAQVGAATPAAAAPSAASSEVACNASDRGPEPKAITGLGIGAKPSGSFEVVVESDPTIADQTIFRPATLGSIEHPILAWGNGGCMKNNSGFSEFLIQLAAQGLVVIADGKPGGTGSSSQDGSQLLKGISWAERENERPCSKYYHKLNVKKIAVSGQSCGGLMAINVSGDKRVTTSMPMNSGLMSRNRALYGALHAPMAIINGGPSDIAYANGKADFEAINNIPIMMANLPVGHGGTYRQDNGGEMTKVAIGWLRWHLFDDLGATGKGMFVGPSCGLCSGTQWDIQWKKKPE